MPKHTDFPTGALVMLALRVLQSGNLHGYAIAQRIRTLSSDVLRIEEGSLYPALQKMLLKKWVSSEMVCLRNGEARMLLTVDGVRPQAASG